jgi:hypothetical protein
MFKTNNRISHEAEQLYTQHKEINDSIDAEKNHIETVRHLGQEATGNKSVDYKIELNSQISDAEYEIYKLDKKADENQQAAEKHLANNPRLFSIAVKEAKDDGVEIKVDTK